MNKLRGLVVGLVPLCVRKVYRNWRYNQEIKRKEKLSTEKVFSEIYRNNLWGENTDYESPFYSGPGTTNENTASYISFLIDFIHLKNLKKIVDLGCGDFRIMRKVLQHAEGVEYVGVDVVPALIDYNQKTFRRPGLSFIQLNAVESNLPNGDLITIRQVLQHLSNSQIRKILDKISVFKYVLITEHLPCSKDFKPNLDKPQGDDIRLYRNSGVFIEESPYNLRAQTVLEYREDLGNIPAVIRTSLIINT